MKVEGRERKGKGRRREGEGLSPLYVTSGLGPALAHCRYHIKLSTYLKF